MAQSFRSLARSLAQLLKSADHLRLYILGAVAAAAAFAFFFHADIAVIVGVLVVGCVAGVYEWSERRKK